MSPTPPEPTTHHAGRTAPAPCDAEYTTAVLRFLRAVEGRPIRRDPAAWQLALADFSLEPIALGLFWHGRNIGEPATPDSLVQAIRLVQAHRATRLKLAHRGHRAHDPALRTTCPVCDAAPNAPCIVRGRTALYRLAGGAHCARLVLAIHRTHPAPPDAEVPG